MHRVFLFATIIESEGDGGGFVPPGFVTPPSVRVDKGTLTKVFTSLTVEDFNGKPNRCKTIVNTKLIIQSFFVLKVRHSGSSCYFLTQSTSEIKRVMGVMQRTGVSW